MNKQNQTSTKATGARTTRIDYLKKTIAFNNKIINILEGIAICFAGTMIGIASLTIFKISFTKENIEAVFSASSITAVVIHFVRKR